MSTGGLTQKVCLKNIIKSLFENEKYDLQDCSKVILTFALANLQQNLIYPTGFTPLGVHIYY